MKIFAILAGLLCTVSFVAQIIKFKRDKTASISKLFLFIYGIGVINWGLLGLSLSPMHMPLVLISFLQLAFVMFIIYSLRSFENGK